MGEILWPVALGVLCVFLPKRPLVLLSVLAVMIADTDLLPKSAIHFARFVPSGVLALRTLLTLGQAGESILSRSRLVRAWIPFLFLGVVSIVYSVDPLLSAQRLLSATFVVIGFGLGVPVFFPSSRDIQILVKQIAVLVGAAVLYSLVLSPTPAIEAALPLPGRVSGVFRNPNTLGLLAMQVSFLLFYAWESTRNPILKRGLSVAIIGTVLAVLISGSRASTVALVTGVLVVTWARATRQVDVFRFLGRIALALAAVLLAGLIFYPEFVTGLVRTEVTSRTFLWGRAWLLAQENPILGVGFGASDAAFAVDSLYLRSVGVFIAGPHSSLMKLLVELGFVGVLAAATAFTSVLLHVLRNLSRVVDIRLAAALLGLTIASLFNSLFESWLFGFGSSSTVPFWLCLALLSHLADESRIRDARRYSRQRSYRGRSDPAVQSIGA